MNRIGLSSRMAPALVLGLFVAQSAAASIFEQSYVYPERAGQNKVRWRNYDWQYTDFLTEPDGQGGVRLYYYEREREAAELAAASITEEYTHLKKSFGIVPDIRMPYILYASHLEFEEQNLFSISESILGVTSPEDLTLSLPYWGEHQRFVEVSRHEMAHQFTIQKAYQVQRLHRTRQNPLERLPLWYIEGLAEFSAHRGMQDEVSMYVADLLLNPDEKKQHKLFPFWHDEIRNFVQTYRMGQVRVSYLAERYGVKAVQDILGKSYLMLQRPDMQPTDQIYGFQSFLEEITATRPKALDADFKQWLRTKFDIERLEKTEEAPKLEEQKAVSDTMDTYAILPDGYLVMFRDVDITTGTTRLRLVDLRDEGSLMTVAEEGKPGIESLHFFQRRVFALRDGELAYTALDKARDILYVQKFERKVEQDGDTVKVSIHLKDKRQIEAKEIDNYEAGDLAFSPDGTQLALVGLGPDGRGDVYVMDLTAEDAIKSMRRLTRDYYSERELAWGPKGLLLSSDRTPSGHYNLFLVDPASGRFQQLSSAEANHDSPSWAADGSILFTSTASGKSNVYRLDGTTMARLTDTHTGLFEPREVPTGLLVRKFFRGRFRLYKANRDELKPLETQHLGAPTVIAASDGTTSGSTAAVPMDGAARPKLPLPARPVGAIAPNRLAGSNSSSFASTAAKPSASSGNGNPSVSDGAPAATTAPGAGSTSSSPPDASNIAGGLNSGRPVAGANTIAAAVLGMTDAAVAATQTALELKASGPKPPSDGGPFPETKDQFERRALGESDQYKSTDLSNWKLDVGGAALTTQQTGGVYLAFSDRMRDQSVVFDVAVNGDFRYTDADILYVNRKRQLTWGLGVLHNLSIRRDTTFSDIPRLQEYYLQRDFGVYAISRYPTNRFTHIQLGVGAIGVHRFDYAGDFFLGQEEIAWNEATGGTDFELDFSLSGGYDTVGYHYLTGPLQGTSLYGKLDYSFIPDHGGIGVFAAKTDLQRYTRVWNGVNLWTRAAAGLSFGDRRFRQQYFVSSYDNLRGFEFNDERLLGYHYVIGNAELQFPLGSIIEKPAIFSLFEGVVGFDIGSIMDDLNPEGAGFFGEFDDRLTADFVLGTNFLMGPFMLRLHFAKPLDVGGIIPNGGSWNTNFSIRYTFQ